MKNKSSTVTKQCEKTLFLHKGVVLNPEFEILFLTMSQKLSKKLDLPGGLTKYGDQSAIDTLRRQLSIEFGNGFRCDITQEVIASINSHRPKEVDVDQTPITMTASICLFDPKKSNIVLTSDRQKELIWLPFDQVQQNRDIPMDVENLTRKAIRSYALVDKRSMATTRSDL